MMKFVVFIFLTIAATLSRAQSQVNFNFDSTTCINKIKFNDVCEPVSIKSTLYLPKAPTDTLITITHGSQGLDERHTNYALQLNGLGYAALVIDHWGPRGIGKAHHDYAGSNQKGARAINMALDSLKAMNLLSKQPYQFIKFGFIGESMGGSAALWFEKNYFYKEYSRIFGSDSLVKPKAIVALYTHCDERNYELGFNAIPTLILSASEDNDTPAKYCQIYSDWVNKDKGGKITFIVLPNQYHDFDAPYRLFQTRHAQNPSDCVSSIRGNIRTWDITGEQFANNAQGYKEYINKCVHSAGAKPVWTGNTGNPKTGFKEWSDFLVKNLK